MIIRFLAVALALGCAAVPAQTALLRASGKLLVAPSTSCDPAATHVFQCGDLRLKSTTLDLTPFANRYVELGGMPSLVTGCGITVDVTEIVETSTKLTLLSFGNYRIGTTMSLLTQAPVGSIVVQLFNAGPGLVPVLQFGTLFLDPNYIQQYAFDIGLGLPLPRVFTIPNHPALVGIAPQFQALVVDINSPLDSKLTNDACFVIRS